MRALKVRGAVTAVYTSLDHGAFAVCGTCVYDLAQPLAFNVVFLPAACRTFEKF